MANHLGDVSRRNKASETIVLYEKVIYLVCLQNYASR